MSLAGLQPQTDADTLQDPQDAVPTGPRPQLRPAGLPTQLPPADLPSNPDITSVIAGIAEEEAATAPLVDATDSAVSASRRPDTRPQNFATVVANARPPQQAVPAPTPEAVAVAPPAAEPAPSAPEPAAPPAEPEIVANAAPPQLVAPLPGGVARAATQEDAILLRDINLIGVYGRPNDRRALVRLPSGRYIRVTIGSTLDGGHVTAIGDNALNYVKRGRTFALEVPNG